MRKIFRAIVVIAGVMLATVAVNAQTGPSPPKKVTLTWVQSTSTVIANGVYRGSVSGGPYTNIAVSSVPSTSYLDANVTPGSTYYYVVTAKASASDESAFSNEAKAVIPLATAAPTGLSVAVTP